MRINWIFLSALCLAAVSLTFSAHGLVSLFQGAGIGIICMAIALEFGKVMSTVYLIRNFKPNLLSLGLIIAVITLVAISSIGIYGYLGQAYGQARRTVVQNARKIAVLEQEIQSLNDDRARLYRLIDDLPAEQGTNRRRMLEQVAPQIATIDSLLTLKRQELGNLTAQQAVEEHDVGQLRYAAELFGMTGDQLARIVIAVLAALLDPLAVLLVLASGVHAERRTNEANTVPQLTTQHDTPPAPQNGDLIDFEPDGANARYPNDNVFVDFEDELIARPPVPSTNDARADLQDDEVIARPHRKRGPKSGLSESYQKLLTIAK